MPKRSSVAFSTILKNLVRIGRYPWIAKQLAGLELDKIFFDLKNPRAASGEAHKIRQLSVRITDMCNLRCHTCGQWGDQGFLHCADLKSLKKEEVTPERYRFLLDDLAKHGHHPSFYLWGGEPMLYKGVLDLIEHATRLKMPTSIATNSTGVADAAERLVDAPMFLLQISIDGHNRETHNAARPAAGNGDNFGDVQKALAAVNEMRKKKGKGLPIIASLTTLSRANMHNVLDIYEAYKDKVDLFVFYLSWWIDEASADAHEVDFARRFGFTPKLHRGWVGDWVIKEHKELAEQLAELQRRASSWNSPPVNIIPNITAPDDLRTYFTDHSSVFGYDRCISIYQAVELDSNGNMSPCRDYHDYVVGNVKDRTITELWNSEGYKKFRASLCKDGLMPACTRCCGLMGY